ncbi:hypothetical protein ABZ920_25810 [Streptomyces sp. NPDC046831]|uniref:hypothetical protein n=1 Tax=Streptomyces sp. NPDC046831 TaxID=3154805 RepID=UPI00340836B7
MPRGRHRHSPPLHRLLPPSAIAGVSLVCALGPWVFTAPSVLRSIAALAAAAAIAGAVVMRRWDAQAGKQVADLTRARASDEWRYEERVAELETDLEESRELRVRLEHKLRAKRAELAGLRNEHAALLRRYATAETERASALEGRRLLEIEAASDDLALPPGTSGTETWTEADAQASAEGSESASENAGAVEAGGEEAPGAGTGVFSPEGSQLFLRAAAALVRLDADADADAGAGATVRPDAGAEDEGGDFGDDDPADDGEPAGDGDDAHDGGDDAHDGGPVTEPAAATGEAASAPEHEARTRPEAAGEHAHADTAPAAGPAEPAKPAQQPAGHFTVPTAVAVVPAAPARRPVVEGGFDFFGTKKGAPAAALDAVQNEDLADVVGQEALALHKAESEARFKPADEDARGVGQVIDLTAHDETEQIDLHGLRSAAS